MCDLVDVYCHTRYRVQNVRCGCILKHSYSLNKTGLQLMSSPVEQVPLFWEVGSVCKVLRCQGWADRETDSLYTRHIGLAAPLGLLEIHPVSILWAWLFWLFIFRSRWGLGCVGTNCCYKTCVPKVKIYHAISNISLPLFEIYWQVSKLMVLVHIVELTFVVLCFQMVNQILLQWNVMPHIRRGSDFVFFTALYCSCLGFTALLASRRYEGLQ